MVFNKKRRRRFKKLVLKRTEQVVDIGEQADKQLERHFFRRLSNLDSVRRFVVSWIVLVVLLIAGVGYQTRQLSSHHQQLAPVAGGIYREGIIGSFTNANPLYATGQADASVARLVSSGLLSYNAANELVPDLVTGYSVDEKGVEYTVTLREGVAWHDGVAFSSDDVVFTYKTIQNADAKSPLLSSWQGVDVKALDAKTVVFKLPSTLSSFVYSLTNGIIPKHILASTEPNQLRSSPFNTARPIGTGPFTFKSVEVSGGNKETRQERVALETYEQYYGEKPKVEGLIIRTFRDDVSLYQAFQDKELTTIAGLASVPDQYKDDQSVTVYSTTLTSAVMAFFNTSAPALSDAKVRQALVQGVDTDAVRAALAFSALRVDAPLLVGQLGYDKNRTQLPYDPVKAQQLLDEAGWLKQPDGSRKKGDQPLSIKLFSQNLPDFSAVAPKLQSQWLALGVAVDVVLQPEDELQSGTSAQHSYDVLLYGISIGKDPDVFAYWHSSQADVRSANRLNLSEYKSKTADIALEAGRTRLDTALRVVKYQPFLDAWKNEAPALALYQPRYIMISQGTFSGFRSSAFNSGIDRYSSIASWMIRQDRVSK